MIKLTNPRRTKILVAARHEACAQIAAETDLSLTEIGTIVGYRDHTSVLHALRKAQTDD